MKYLPFHMKPVEIGLYGTHEPAIFSFIRHDRWLPSAHDEEKREKSESI